MLTNSLKMYKYIREREREPILVNGKDYDLNPWKTLFTTMHRLFGNKCSGIEGAHYQRSALSLSATFTLGEIICNDRNHVNKPWLSCCKEVQFQLSFQHHSFKLWTLPSNETKDSKTKCDFIPIRIDILCLGNFKILYVPLTQNGDFKSKRGIKLEVGLL